MPVYAPLPELPAELRHRPRLAEKKATEPQSERASLAPEFATLVWVHDGTALAIDQRVPSTTRFEHLVADRVTRDTTNLAPELLQLLRTVAQTYPHARIELVSGYRSPKFNEMLRKKGRKVAKESQHSEGHAVDFRIIPEGAEEALDPFEVERWLRDHVGWRGGIGVYPGKTDRFVHADVGKQRRWVSR